MQPSDGGNSDIATDCPSTRLHKNKAGRKKKEVGVVKTGDPSSSRVFSQPTTCLFSLLVRTSSYAPLPFCDSKSFSVCAQTAMPTTQISNVHISDGI
ncbi:hypothetical protein CEXT_693891 [Caerostris extrusa]|uniref:Uncharacterized protein n=1 Tax=Caerostris extrusa TaxID=172846 RepID=A0AAV4X0H9_CAEEX|nr:hypothetical protein CEXT_693891 [Caerostris extrusa]